MTWNRGKRNCVHDEGDKRPRRDDKAQTTVMMMRSLSKGLGRMTRHR